MPPGASQHQKIVIIDGRVAFSRRARPDDPPLGHAQARGCQSLARRSGRPTLPSVPRCAGDGRRRRCACPLPRSLKSRWRRATADDRPARTTPRTTCGRSLSRPTLSDVEVGIARTHPLMEDAARGPGSRASVPRIRSMRPSTPSTSRTSFHLQPCRRATSSIACAKGRTWRSCSLAPRTTRAGWKPAPCAMAASGSCAPSPKQDCKIASNCCSLMWRAGARPPTPVIHSKVMVVDDRLLRIGSANINNRSMGTDTECDLSDRGRTTANATEQIAPNRETVSSPTIRG